jgi:hypothetical protein
VLEDLQQFLSALKLPRKLIVRLDECGAATVHFQPGGPVTVCYEYIEEIERIAYGPLRSDMITGAFVQELLHEVARGVFDVLNVPIWGRVSDAADNFAAYIMLQFGKDVALRTVRGTHLFFGAIAIFGSDTSAADVRSSAAQRNFNTICIAYGGDPTTFNDIVDVDDRFTRCRARGVCRLGMKRRASPSIVTSGAISTRPSSPRCDRWTGCGRTMDAEHDSTRRDPVSRLGRHHRRAGRRAAAAHRQHRI